MAKTKVTGYFNPHPWPLALSISKLGINITLAKGEFVKDAMGRKVNDPILDQYTGKNMLSTERSHAEVDTVFLAASARAARSSSGVMGTADVRAAVDKVGAVKSNVRSALGGTAVIPQPRQQQPVRTSPSSSSIKAFSVDEARRLGLIGKPPKTPVGEPVEPDDAPDEETEDDGYSRESSELLDLGKIDEDYGSKIDIPETRSEFPVPEQKVLPVQMPDLPMPKLEDLYEDEDGSESSDGNEDDPIITDKDRKYVCAIDKRDFRFRSELERYARDQYPDKFDEIMKPYPPKKKGKRRR